MKLNAIDDHILETIADLHGIPQGAYNIRKNGAAVNRQSTDNIEIIAKEDKPGIDVVVKPGTKNESIHIPVLVTSTGLKDLVYNTFDIGEEANILIIAGCGIHNPGNNKAQHDGIHEIIVKKGARLRYIEKHYGEGPGEGEKILNPKTILHIEEGGSAELELIQIRGVDNTVRHTEATVKKKGYLLITERMLTHGKQFAKSQVVVNLVGEDAATQIISRTVAQDDSEQIFYPRVISFSKSRGHVECDSIIMDRAKVRSIPEISANHAEAELIHEAAIGKIAGEQLVKLMSLGLTEIEAVETILQGFLK